MTISADEDAPNPSGIAFDALRDAVSGDLVNGEGTFDHDGKVYDVRSVHWSLIEDSFS